MNFPRNDLDDQDKLLTLAGGLWSSAYGGSDLVQTMLAGVGELHQRVQQIYVEAQATAGRRNFPAGHTEEWYGWTLSEAAQATDSGALWHLDTDGVQLDAGYQFDTPFEAGYRLSLPADLLDVAYISDRLGTPNYVLSQGIDFVINKQQHTITFRTNPFDTFPTEPVFLDGEVVDRQLVLWLFRPVFDWQLPYYHLGYLLRLQLASTPAAIGLLNTVLDAITGGTSLEQIDRLVSYVYDMPLCRQNGEIVEDIWQDAAQLCIVTDRTVYRASPTAVSAVRVDDVLLSGQSLVTGLKRLKFNRGQLDDDIPALGLTRGMLSADFISDLVFENRTVPLVVDGVPGNERVSFEIGGHPADVTAFWDTVHMRRLVYGQSLYELMAAQSRIPTTVNPAKFLVQNILRNNYLAYRIALDQIGPDNLEIGPRDIFTLLMPPRSDVLLVYELPRFGESVTMTLPSDFGIDMLEALDWSSSGETVLAVAVDDSDMELRVINAVC